MVGVLDKGSERKEKKLLPATGRNRNEAVSVQKLDLQEVLQTDPPGQAMFVFVFFFNLKPLILFLQHHSKEECGLLPLFRAGNNKS